MLGFGLVAFTSYIFTAMGYEVRPRLGHNNLGALHGRRDLQRVPYYRVGQIRRDYSRLDTESRDCLDFSSTRDDDH